MRSSCWHNLTVGLHPGPEEEKMEIWSRSRPDFVSLSRCAGCYNQRKSYMLRRGDNGESSSSAEDSGPEVDWESEPESSCSSSSSEQVLAEIPEKPETEEHSAVSGDAAEPESEGQEGDGQTGETSESQEDKKRTKGVIQRAPLVKSFSLPSFTPHLTPLSLLPRPPRVVSTLHLQVLQQKHDSDTFYTYTLRQHLSARQEDKTEESKGGINNLLPPQPFQQWQQGLPWQQRSEPTSQQHQDQQQQLSHQHQQPPHQLSHQYRQQQKPQLFSPLSAQGQRLPPPPHPLPVLPPPALYTPLQAPNAPQTHLHALAPETCWYCYCTHFPHTYWSHYISGQLPR